MESLVCFFHKGKRSPCLLRNRRISNEWWGEYNLFSLVACFLFIFHRTRYKVTCRFVTSTALITQATLSGFEKVWQKIICIPFCEINNLWPKKINGIIFNFVCCLWAQYFHQTKFNFIALLSSKVSKNYNFRS